MQASHHVLGLATQLPGTSSAICRRTKSVCIYARRDPEAALEHTVAHHLQSSGLSASTVVQE